MLRNNADAHISSLGYLWEDPMIFSPKTSEDFRRRSDGFRSSQENLMMFLPYMDF